MRQYQAPDFEVKAFSVEDVITTSGNINDDLPGHENMTPIGSVGAPTPIE